MVCGTLWFVTMEPPRFGVYPFLHPSAIKHMSRDVRLAQTFPFPLRGIPWNVDYIALLVTLWYVNI